MARRGCYSPTSCQLRWSGCHRRCVAPHRDVRDIPRYAGNAGEAKGDSGTKYRPSDLKRHVPPDVKRDVPRDVKRDIPPDVKRDVPPDVKRDVPPIGDHCERGAMFGRVATGGQDVEAIVEEDFRSYLDHLDL